MGVNLTAAVSVMNYARIKETAVLILKMNVVSIENKPQKSTRAQAHPLLETLRLRGVKQ